MATTRILIADDHQQVRRSIRSLLEACPDWTVCGEAVDGKDAVVKTSELKPDVVLLDVTMPKMNGLDAARLILQDCDACKIVILSQNDPAMMQEAAKQAGAKAFIPKSKVGEDLVPAILKLLHSPGANGDVTRRKLAEESYRHPAETLDNEVRARTKELEERNQDVLRQSEQLRDLSWRLLRTQEEERRHIARELHDSAGQTLAVLSMDLGSLVTKISQSAPDLAGKAEGIQEIVRQLHSEIRTASYLLHPPLLDENGLALALNWYVQGLVERSGLDVSLNIPEDFGRLPADMELAIFRLVQECLTNIHRHSGSKTAAISITRDPANVTVTVEDHGKGMSAERLSEIQSRGSGVGIRGIHERLRQFRGQMTVDSNPSGTRVFVTIPIPQVTGD